MHLKKIVLFILNTLFPLLKGHLFPFTFQLLRFLNFCLAGGWPDCWTQVTNTCSDSLSICSNTLSTSVPIGELPQFFVLAVSKMCPSQNKPHQDMVWFLQTTFLQAAPGCTGHHSRKCHLD